MPTYEDLYPTEPFEFPPIVIEKGPDKKDYAKSEMDETKEAGDPAILLRKRLTEMKDPGLLIQF